MAPVVLLRRLKRNVRRLYTKVGAMDQKIQNQIALGIVLFVSTVRFLLPAFPMVPSTIPAWVSRPYFRYGPDRFPDYVPDRYPDYHVPGCFLNLIPTRFAIPSRQHILYPHSSVNTCM